MGAHTRLRGLFGSPRYRRGEQGNGDQAHQRYSVGSLKDDKRRGLLYIGNSAESEGDATLPEKTRNRAMGSKTVTAIR